MTTWYSGGPEDLETHSPALYAMMPASVKTLVAVSSPPLTPLGMLGTMGSIAGIPFYGAPLAIGLYSYADYYATAYAANPPGTSTDDPNLYSIPADYEPYPAFVNDMWDYVKVQSDRMYNFLADWQTEKAKLDWMYNNWPDSGGTPPPLATTKDTARILAALYYIAQSVIVPAWSIDNSEVLSAISDAHGVTDGKIDALDLTVDGFATNTQNAFDSLASEVGNVDTAVDDVLAAVQALPTTGGGPGGWPGLSEATLSTPVSWTGPLDHVEAMDGCIVHITSEPSGTGKQEVGSHTSWQHAGWLAFISDNGDADELQWLNLGDAVYVPKRMSAVAGVILFPRLGSSGTLTPWTRNA